MIRTQFVPLSIARSTLPAAGLALVLLGCGGDSTVDFEGPDFADDASDLGERDNAPTTAPPPDELDKGDPGDPFLAQLDHVLVFPSSHGFEIVGFDRGEQVVGRIAADWFDPFIIINQTYPRQCDPALENDVIAQSEGCADVFLVTARIGAGDPDQRWADVYQTLPSGTVAQRTQAMIVMAGDQPQPIIRENFHCAISIAAAGALCAAGSPTAPLGGAVICAAGLSEAVCNCREQAKKAFPDFDFDKVCRTKKSEQQ